MTYKKNEWLILVKVVLMTAVISVASFCVFKEWYVYEIILVPVILMQIADFYRLHRKAQEEVEEFVESIHYRDFSRYFNVRNAPMEIKALRKGFNDINTTFKVISKEKETQYQYLQKILELVDTGILSFDTETGEVVWMNESLKKLLGLPYLKTVSSLTKRDSELAQLVLDIKPGDQKIATAHVDNRTFKMLLSATAFQTDSRKYKLIAFQNVDEALDETESKAWQRLLSVLTHEIMNSVAPISSLANTLENRLAVSVASIDADEGEWEDLKLGIATIRKRSEGLLKFAETYRNLNKITTPNVRKVYVRELFSTMHQLMQPTLDQKNIELEILLKEPELNIELDPELVEQVVINLIINAIEAVKDRPQPKITLTAYETSFKRKIIRIADNGSGIEEELLDKIFIPFFSTKKNGSGIGLSLCKQIMLLHKGNIQVQSVMGEGTAFMLQF
ncbi:MAG: hypothetical protein JWN76_662 [Chitinophagaceae bacterium]|nr:hypothetical protein [Chitinophagaceae bacterium]